MAKKEKKSKNGPIAIIIIILIPILICAMVFSIIEAILNFIINTVKAIMQFFADLFTNPLGLWNKIWATFTNSVFAATRMGRF